MSDNLKQRLVAMIEVIPNSIKEEWEHEMHFIADCGGELMLINNYFYFDMSTTQSIFNRGDDILTRWLLNDAIIQIPSFSVAKQLASSNSTIYIIDRLDKTFTLLKCTVNGITIDPNYLYPMLLLDGDAKSLSIISINESRGRIKLDENGYSRDAIFFTDELDAKSHLRELIVSEFVKDNKKLATLKKQIHNKLNKMEELKNKLKELD